MTAQELRIGNIVSRRAEKTKWVNHRITAKEISDAFEFPNYFEMHFEPIPLTQTWLTMFGFELMKFKMAGCKVYQIDNFRVLKTNKAANYSVTKKSLQSFYIKTGVNTVHELQNIYFAVTGEELRLNTINDI